MSSIAPISLAIPISLARTRSTSPHSSIFASRVSPRLQCRFPTKAAPSAWKCIHIGFRSAALTPCPAPADGNQIEAGDYIVVNFYCFVFVQEPQELLAAHLSFMEGRNIHGRIYLNEQGINAQYSGPKKDALSYVEFVKEDQRFSNILVQTSPTLYGHVFPRLKLRYKPSLVQVEGEISQLPLLESAMRATPLTPSQWRNRLEAINNGKNLSNVDISTKCIILDVRNGYEWDIGHFQGAQRPNVDCFRSTSFGLSESEVLDSDPLAAVDKDKTDILMYCTGGIRCDVYSTVLRGKGFKRLYTLKGGVSNYLKAQGSVGWIGNLFVFDARLSLPPSSYNSEAENQRGGVEEALPDKAFARCYICNSHITELRHRNCANIDCNLLFLCCKECSTDLRGCCCLKCTTAPRLRPVLPGHQRYAKWHHYRDLEVQVF